MKQNVIGQSPADCQKAIRRQILFCVAVGVVTLALNVVFTALRTAENHTLMLILNIAADSLCGCFLLYYISVPLLRRYRLFQLMLRVKTSLSGTVEEIRPNSTRYMSLDCLEVVVAGRRYFLPTNTMQLQLGQAYRLSIVSNFIVEAEQ